MTRQLPPPLSDDQISAAVDGTAGDDVIRHVADCSLLRRASRLLGTSKACLPGG